MDATHYETLRIAPGAAPEAVRRAYLGLARQLHPDVNPAPGAEETMKRVNAAYAVLADPAARRRYDAELALTIRTNTRPGGKTMSETYATEPETRRGGEVAIPLPVVPQSFHQLGIFVLDGSGSMTELAADGLTKAQAVSSAVRDLFTRFKVSRQKSNFSFAVVAFDQDAGVRLGVTAAGDVDDNADYDPLAGRGGGTFIGSGLEAARTLADTFLAQARADIPASVVIVVMSDGMCGDPAGTLAAAGKVKQRERVRLCATYFARVGQSDPAAQETLKKIATDPVGGYKTVYDAESLRAFFIASMSAGQNL